MFAKGTVCWNRETSLEDKFTLKIEKWVLGDETVGILKAAVFEENQEAELGLLACVKMVRGEDKGTWS